jgi:hypothetical protein
VFVEQTTAAAKLCNVGAQDDSNTRESAIQTASQTAHAGRSCKCNQSKNQKVLHQALASFIFVQPGKAIQNKSRHSCKSPRNLWLDPCVIGGHGGSCCVIS